MLSRLKTALRALLRRTQVERELDEELRYHIERQTEQNLRSGMNPEEARREALKAFGGVGQAKERSRDARGVRWLEELWQDLRYGARMLVKKPGFTLIAVITLALGIGANTAIFSVINALLLNPLPFPELDRVVAVWEKGLEVERTETTVANYLDWRAQNRSFEHIAIYRWWAVNMTGIEPPERVTGFLVSPNFLDALGVKPALGRGFQPGEDQPGKDNVAILLHDLWNRRFGGDRNIIGRTVALNGAPCTIIGVMPPEFDYPRGAEVLTPLVITPELARNRENHAYLSVGRLKQSVSLAQARRDLETIDARLEQEYPATNKGRGARVYPLLDDTVRPYRTSLLMLTGAVGFVLLIACANVANLLLVRAAGRRREMAIRAALGANRWRVTRQLLAESIALALISGAVGVLLALWGIALLRSAMGVQAQYISGWNNLGIDVAALGFTLGLSALTGVLFGLAPVAQVSVLGLNEALKEGGKGTTGDRLQSLRNLLVIVEVALSLTLLIGAGLLMKNFWRLLHANPGFNPTSVLTMRLTLTAAKYNDLTQPASFARELDRRVAALPGIESVGLVNHIPLAGSNSSGSFLIEGAPEPPPGQRYSGRFRACTPDYFRTLGITLKTGRGFTAQDNIGAPLVVIINETLERRYWPNGDAIGKRIRFIGPPEQSPWMQIVGVVNDVKHLLDETVTPEYYLPFNQLPVRSLYVAARTKTDPLALASAIRNEVLAIDKGQPVSEVRTMEQVRSQSVTLYSFSSALLGIFAAIALTLAAVGIYGVMSYAVTQRTREIGLRLALGAQASDALRLVIGRGMKLTLIGVTVGLVASLALTRLMKNLLIGVTATDPLTFAAIALLLMAVGLLACWIPARRATKVDPLIALKAE